MPQPYDGRSLKQQVEWFGWGSLSEEDQLKLIESGHFTESGERTDEPWRQPPQHRPQQSA